jgi:hypothetical protein
MTVNKTLLKDTLLWGFIVWLVGYGLGIMFFTIVPPNLIGWFITPIGIAVSLFVLFRMIKEIKLNYYLIIAVVWTLIAIVFDYFFLVKAFKPADGYYKLDVYIYYTLTFLLPLLVGYIKSKRVKKYD